MMIICLKFVYLIYEESIHGLLERDLEANKNKHAQKACT